MYKDKAKQKQANKEANKRYREHKRGITQKVSPEQGITPKNTIPAVILNKVLPANFGLSDCACLHCRLNRSSGNEAIINHGPAKTAEQLSPMECNRQSLPGDVDYVLN